MSKKTQEAIRFCSNMYYHLSKIGFAILVACMFFLGNKTIAIIFEQGYYIELGIIFAGMAFDKIEAKYCDEETTK